MKKPLIGVATLATVGLGFVVGQLNANGPSTVSPGMPVYASGQGQPNVQRQDARIQWEYKELQKNANEITTQEFDQLGCEGWEMCGVRQRGQGVSYFYFKRERLADGNAGCCEPTLPSGYSPNPTQPSAAPTLPTATKPIGSTGITILSPDAPGLSLEADPPRRSVKKVDSVK
jgi:hypothetical protein